jgi:hypothetical protein
MSPSSEFSLRSEKIKFQKNVENKKQKSLNRYLRLFYLFTKNKRSYSQSLKVSSVNQQDTFGIMRHVHGCQMVCFMFTQNPDLGKFYGHMVYLTATWYIYPVLVCCTKKNVATPVMYLHAFAASFELSEI